MGKKTLWIAIGVLFILGIYNAWNNYLLSVKFDSLAERISQENVGDYKIIEHYGEFSIIERKIPIVAVSSSGNGVIGNLTLKLIPGNNNVLISTNPFTETDIQYSVNKAVAVAKLRSNYKFNRDFIFSYEVGDARLIGGESAGAATTILTIAALQNKTIKNNVVITGTINPDGTIGRVSGILEKAKAAADSGYRYFLVPRGQSRITYYEKQITREPIGFGLEILNTRYIPKTIDLKKVAKEEWGLNVVEVSTIDEALPYFIE
ncbi:MAG: hypothetical protein DRO94_00925 [Candidatus Altiarchaeales archaeon]|nr:MAG: hypothetical protein DRO94_00925 [Candidatus Altiarchaeales archaeon]HDO82241.1 hypothetical protein [Candidatus Altiarchaeales archaeon]HEX54890.1 hypothetical protein [Candidatus Altiarchaeales archaeon]